MARPKLLTERRLIWLPPGTAARAKAVLGPDEHLSALARVLILQEIERREAEASLLAPTRSLVGAQKRRKERREE